ncbi:hypothetical protein MMC16_000649 [Acarospora aff. strigata]|nr:hypothetical protein [Acarospora aff. strigata]
MASTRIVSYRSIDQLAAAAGKQQLRRLHMTGAHATPSPLLSSGTSASYQARSVTDLKTECRNKNLSASGSRAELVERLSNNDIAHVRSFATAMASSRRPTAAESPAEPQLTRHFNTTRALKSVNDSSTIDFAYMPQFELDLSSNEQQIRVPLLPDNYYPTRKSAALQEAIEPVMRPEISVMSGETAHIAGPSAMSEVVDNHAMDLDPYDLTSKVHTAASKIVGVPVEKLNEPGVLTELWNGLLDDLLGKRASKA